MDLLTAPLYLLLTIYQFALVVRIVFDLTQQYARSWRPKGFALMIAVGVYTITDPPIRWIQRKVPPLNLGGVSLDMGFLLVFLVVVIAKMVLRGFA
ncbi:YggT family protein [Nesterenkonia sp. LB17]|uniref:YggT family protein n=1 Tax=unclassified Nesterenkonia TaxID=2629769 RepID=UPI001F4D300F|nr:YggT family protein [Nesterenkonia sp. DZ6]MCH8561697.1 YggT family protein [Nesterenkonia sp. YGD6]MCH8564788.1 YggT family protein [Nesterenkonia sp. LB17]MCH8570404.1 YggT family protein [Nesterenkonia sp. AY15]